MSIGIQGLSIGTITNVQDPEQRGRVQLQVPDVLGGGVSAWAPIANGKIADDGSPVSPQPGDGVVVGFIGGNALSPVVIGWQSGHAPVAPPAPAPAISSATELALRAIITGLYSSRAISSAQVGGVMAALKEAAGAAQGRRESETAKALLRLMKGLHIDTAVG
jgi:uncharacterized protein involved in type VI secretion and phage assembly